MVLVMLTSPTSHTEESDERPPTGKRVTVRVRVHPHTRQNLAMLALLEQRSFGEVIDEAIARVTSDRQKAA